MIDPVTARRIVFGTLFTLIAGFLIFLHLLPVEVGPRGYPGPDILICVAFAWVIRRPAYVPPFLIAAIFLLTDMLYLRPPGIWTALVVLAAEYLRHRETTWREQTFVAEWVMVSVILVTLMILNRVILAVFFVDQVSLGLTVLQLLATIVIYPIVVMLSQLVSGLRKIAPGETEAMGQRT